MLIKTEPHPAGDQKYIYDIINYLKENKTYSYTNDPYYTFLFNYYIDGYGNVVNNVMYQYFFKNFNMFYLYNFLLYILSFHVWIKVMNTLNINNIYLYMILYSLCSPLLLYTCFYYGKITGLCGITLSIYCILNILNNKRKISTFILLFIVNFVMVLEKENTLIFVISEIMTIVLFLFKFDRTIIKRSILLLLMILSSTLLVTPITNEYAELKGFKKNKANVLGYIAMGVHDHVSDNSYLETTGIGIEGGFDESNWKYQYNEDSSGYELKNISNDEYKDDILNCLNKFINNPLYGAKFYFNKLFKQWCTNDFNTGPNVRRISGKNKITIIDNINMFISNGERMFVYFIAFMVVLLSFKDDNKLISFCKILLLVLFIGNFLFSIIWEAKPRYCIYGYYALILYISLSCTQIFNKKQNLIKNLKINQ